MRRFWDWLIGVKREDRPYAYHRHRAWEERELVPSDYIPQRALERWCKSPNAVREMLLNYRPIVRTGFGKGFASRQVEMWAYQRQRLYDLRYRAARRKRLQETWGWMNIPLKEFTELWPRSGLAFI